MSMSNDLHEMNQALISEIQAQEQNEIAHSQHEMHRQGLQSQLEGNCCEDSLKLAGVDAKAVAELEEKVNEKDKQDYDAIETMMSEESYSEIGSVQSSAIEPGIVPEGAQIITPSWHSGFSDTLEDNSMAKAADVSAQPVLGGGVEKNYWNWASGAGMGCVGGVGQNTQTATWVFWFRPTQSRFYTINPRFVFNGYYIAKANDKWYNCKNAKVRITAETQAYQYNWKHSDGVNLINISSGNININKRLDDVRYTNYSALLGKDDWAAVVCRVRLYVRAQGGGSYAKNDFSTGANKLAVPHVIVR